MRRISLRFSALWIWFVMITSACATAGTPAGEAVDARTPPDNRGPDGGVPDASPPAPQIPDASPTVADASPPPDAACTRVQLLINPDFDQGPTGWDEESEFELITLASELSQEPHSGNYVAWLGGLEDTYEQLGQEVAVPAGARDLQISGYIWIISEESGAVAHDNLAMTLSTPGGGTLEGLKNWNNLDDGGASTWIPFTVTAAAAYAGREVYFHFESYNSSDDPTSFFIDTLAVHVTVCE